MSTLPFAHLHCHSHYSLLDGASPIGALVDKARESGMNALALTDHGNLYGALEFYRRAREAGINPVLGMEAYIAPGSRFQKDPSAGSEGSYHLTLLAQNRQGFQNLIKLSSRAFLEGFYRKPRIDRALLEEYHEGIICLSGCVSGEFSRALLKGGDPELALQEAMEIARWFHNLLGDRYFIEIQNNGLEIQRQAMQGAVDVAQRLGLPLVATSDAHYVNQGDHDAQDILLCVNTGKFRTDANRMRMETNQFHLRTPEEMYEAFPGYEDALRRSQEIADSVDVELELGKRHFPSFDVPEGKTSDEYLRELCVAGLKERYAGDAEMCPGGELSADVQQRLDRELSVISKLGFPNYFLIVWDFVRYAVEQGIPSTARGSGVGSLVAYALRLSHVCPLKYDLLFERFLDESRLEAPDIDIDFCKERRGEVIDYVKHKYGAANVAQIGTFGTLAARAAIRDVGRALSIPISRVDQIVAMVPDQLGITLEKALEKSDELSRECKKDGQVAELIDLARCIEGLARNVGTHAAAVVIADRPLDDYVPLQRVTGKEEVITQWAMGDVEAAGLLKMDFLGLRNLTILSKAVRLIEQTTGRKIDPEEFPLDDEETFALLCRGETKGIFQLESGGIRDLLQRMKPDHFRDIIATNALYRPGPLEGGMVDDYIAVKHGLQAPEYKHPVMEEVLEETHGVMVYQEQVMRILNRLGGIQLADAYKCIKAISKKKLPIIAKYREEFLAGATAQGLARREAEDLFGLIEKFAGYGFNKCLAGSTEIIDATSGERTTVESLHDQRRAFRVHSLGADGRLRPRAVTDVVSNGRKQVYRLRTAKGMTVTATANHRLRTFGGWRELGQLQPGDALAAPRRLAVAGSATWPRHELVALACLLSRGTRRAGGAWHFHHDRPLIEEFAECVEQFPHTAARVHHNGGRLASVEVVAAAPPEGTAAAGGPRGGRVGIVPTAGARVQSGALAWAAGLALLDGRPEEARMPPEVFRLADEDIELLLGRLWAADGCVGKPGQMPYLATTSPALARDVQTLLLRLGILSGVQAKAAPPRQGGGRAHKAHGVCLFGDDAGELFCRRVAPHVPGAEEQVAAFREHLDVVRSRRTSKDTVPAEVRRLVDQLRQAAGLSWRELQRRSGVAVREFYGKATAGKKGFRRRTLAQLAKTLGSAELEQVATSDVFWDRVKSIEPLGVQETYDLTVEHDHNFVADGLVVHNSHSTAYAKIAYMTAYLKAHYPVEFMAALLSGDIPGRNFKTKDSLVEHLEDCRRMNIEVVPPDVNTSEADFTVADGKIHFGLTAIKGCGGPAAAAIAKARQDGRFRDLFDFCERVDPAQCNRSTIESLIKSGALDSTGARRAQCAAALERALQQGVATWKDRRSGQKNMFDAFEDDEADAGAAAGLPDLPEWEEREKLGYEREVLGFYLSSHPLAEHEATLSTYCSHTTVEAAALGHRAEVYVGGMLSALKFSHTKNPRPGQTATKYAMFDLEDTAGIIRCILWPEQFEQYGHLVVPEAILVARGAVDKRPGSEEANLIINELIPLADLAGRYTKGVIIRVDERQHALTGLEQLYEIVRGYPGDCQLQLLLCLSDGARVYLNCEGTRLELNAEMRSRVEQLLGPGNFRLITSPPKPAEASTRGRNGFVRSGK